MKNQTLYFIAIIPEEPLRKQLNALKEEFSTSYHTYHALKSPPHITLIPPFIFAHQKKQILTSALQEFAHLRSVFEVSILNYGAFKPRVIYLNISKNDSLDRLHQMITNKCSKELGINMNKSLPFHPHMTLAFRDLSPQMFHKAWERYKVEYYWASFNVMSLFLVEHNGKNWEIAHEFPFAPPILPS